jgi:DNA-binding MurR/RpiR family transcriptional regulator
VVADLVGVIQEDRRAFSLAEGRLAELILRDIDAALNDSIVELARRAEVSPPTVTRFCRRLGCRSFAEFKVRLAQSRFVGKRYLTPPPGPRSPAEIAEHIVNCAQSTLAATHGTLDLAAIDEAAALIADASAVLAFGSGGSSSVIAYEIENRLFRFGLNVAVTTDHQMQLMRGAGAPDGAVVIASSLSGRNQALAGALRAAGEYDVKRIVLTRPGTVVAGEADVLLGIDLPEGQDVLRPTSTRYAYLLVVDILSQIVATRLGPPAVTKLRRIKHHLVATRDEDDRQALGD